ncbi:MAG: TonB-dependent receptor, partial [Planctomycetota bacterium]
TTSYFSSAGGNPNLEPTITDNFDVSYERYFGEGGYFAVAGFYRLFESYVPTVDVPLEIVDFAGIPANGTEVPLTTTGYRFGRENITSGGFIRGIEISASLPMVNLSEALDGFGVIGSFSLTGSEIEIIPGFDIPVPGLSERVGNGTLYYEKNGFGARISARYRSEFLGEVPGFGAVGQFVLVEAETILDAQLSYEFQDGPLAGLSLIGQAENLTDEEFVTLQGPDERFIRDFNTFGRTFLFGAAYKF